MSETFPRSGSGVDQRLLTVPIGKLHPDPDNPRDSLGDLHEMVASLEQVGMLQPIIARKTAGKLVVLAGHRRLEAARLAGWDTVPVIVRPDMRPDDVLVAMLAENNQRRDLDPIEEARAFARLMKLHGTRSHKALAELVGRTQVYVSGRLALLALSAAEQAELRVGQMKLVEGTARARMNSGRVRPPREASRHWFGAQHELAPKAKARCRRLGHKRHMLPGGIACPECWESVIRSGEREHQHDASAQAGACVTCGGLYGDRARSAS